MAAPHMTTKIRKALNEYIETIPADDLELFVKIPDTQPGHLDTNYNFDSEDFHLAFLGEQDGEPQGCWYFEVRGSPTSKHSAIEQLAKKNSKYDQNQKVFAHVAYEENVVSWFHAEHVRHAIGLSPLWEAGCINKVHVTRNPKVEFLEFGVIQIPYEGFDPVNAFVYEPIPFQGFESDGTKTKQKKSAGEGSSKSSGKPKKK